MKIDFGQLILDAKGNEVQLNKDNEEKATLGFVASTALFTPIPGDEKLDGMKKAKMGELGLKLYKCGEQEITPEELVLIRERIGLVFTPLIIARAFSMLDTE